MFLQGQQHRLFYAPSDASQAQGTIPASKICQTSIWRRAVGEQLFEVIFRMIGRDWSFVYPDWSFFM